MKNAYGQQIEVDGKNMTVEILSSNETDPVIILLPGWGSASPVLEFRPLAEKLSKKCTVVTVEPFGYGLSDDTDSERSIKNITEELRKCVHELGYNKYFLMGHSISGLYSLYWSKSYPNEVEGFIGIDPSVPHMIDKENEPFPISSISLNKLSAYITNTMNFTGLTRLLSLIHPEKAINSDRNYAYTKKEMEIFRILTLDKAYNKTVLNEVNSLKDNINMMNDFIFPEDIPVLQFLSKENCELMPAWEQLHYDVSIYNGEIIILEGTHYLHLENRDEIATKTLTWIEKNQE